jgi:iron complex outermembrane receptor protein
MPLVSAPQGRIARSRAKSPARSSILLLVSALLSWARSARAEQDGGAPDESVAGPPVEVSYEATVRTSRQGANAQTTVVDADRFAGEARTVAELIATSPGVSVQNSGGPGQAAFLSLRGASPDQSLVLLDGIPLQGPGGDAIDLSTLPSSFVSKVVVSRGVLGAQLGAGALGGAVELVPKRVGPSEPRFGVQLSAGSFGTAQLAVDAAIAAANAALWTVALQLDRTEGDFPYARQFTPEIRDAPYYAASRENADAVRGSLLVRGEVPLRGGLELDLLFQGTAANRGLPGPVGMFTPRARESDQGGVFGARLRATLGETVISARAWGRASLVQLRALGLGFDCPQGGSSPACAVQQSHTVGTRAEMEVAFPLSASHSLTTSLSAGGEWLAGSYAGIHRREIGSLAVSDDASFLQQALSVHPALRLDLVGGVAAVSPGLTATARPFSGSVLQALELRAGVGASFRPPAFSELYLDTGPTQPNPNLRPERALSIDTGLRWKAVPLTASVGVFWSRYRDLIVYELFPPARVKPYNIGAARISGAEVQLGIRLPFEVGLELAYSFVDAINERPSATQQGRKLSYRSPHRLFARLDRRSDRLEGFAEVEVSSATPRNGYGTAELPTQVRVDAGAGLRVAGPLWVDLEVRNLLDDRTQQDLFQYPLPGASFQATARARF